MSYYEVVPSKTLTDYLQMERIEVTALPGPVIALYKIIIGFLIMPWLLVHCTGCSEKEQNKSLLAIVSC